MLRFDATDLADDGHSVLESIPSSDDMIVAAGAAIGLSVANECLPGVRLNLAVLREHATILLDAPPVRSVDVG